MTSVSTRTASWALLCIAVAVQGCGDSGGDGGSSGTGAGAAGTTVAGTGGTAGTAAGTGGTAGTAAGTGGTAAADPVCVADWMANGLTEACAQCGCTKCASQYDAVYNPIDPALGALAQAVVACGRDNCCRGTESYCGKPYVLTDCAAAAKGPCVAPIEAAAGGMMGLLAIAGPAADPTTALGAATAFGYCVTGNPMNSAGMVIPGMCEAECMPTSCSTMMCAPVP